MIDNIIDKWIERVQNLLDVQKYEQEELMTTRFTRKDLIELRILLNSLKELKEENCKDEKQG